MVANRLPAFHNAIPAQDAGKPGYDEDTGHDILAPVLRAAQARARPIARVDVATGRSRLIQLLRIVADEDAGDPTSGDPLPNPALIRTPNQRVGADTTAPNLPQDLIDEMLNDEFRFIEFPKVKPEPLVLRAEDQVRAPTETAPALIRPKKPPMPKIRRRDREEASFVKLGGKIWAID
jgi:hypothetical protein